jgi:hypothetical protein
MREDIAYGDRKFQFFGDGNEIFAVSAQAMQPDDAVRGVRAAFQCDIGKSVGHFVRSMRILVRRNDVSRQNCRTGNGADAQSGSGMLSRSTWNISR